MLGISELRSCGLLGARWRLPVLAISDLSGWLAELAWAGEAAGLVCEIGGSNTSDPKTPVEIYMATGQNPAAQYNIGGRK